MEELAIQTHDFEKAKNELKRFSEGTTADLDLKKVDSDKGAGEFLGDFFLGRGIGLNHTVKGSELNELTTDIQKHLIDINNTQRKFINEIGQVYTALEALDNDYIQAIVIAIKSAQKANKEVKLAQSDIERTVEEQKKIIKVLQQFKGKLDKLKHIADIDKIWVEVKKCQEEVATAQKSLIVLEKFRIRVDKNKQLSNIDKLWKDVQTTNELINTLNKRVKFLFEKLDGITEQVNSNQMTLDDILTKINEINSISHLSDIDSMYQEMRTLNESKCALIEKNNSLLDYINNLEDGFSKKILVAYILAGGSIGLAVIEFIFIMVGLI